VAITRLAGVYNRGLGVEIHLSSRCWE